MAVTDAREAALAEALASCLAGELGPGVRVTGLRPLGGGASREILTFEAKSGEREVPLVLSRPLSGPGRRMDVGLERGTIAAAQAAGVPVPRPYAELPPGEHGAGGLVVERMDGEALPPRILRDERFAAARERLVQQTAAAAAALHALPPEAAGLPADPRSTTERALGDVEAAVDAGGQPHPAIELGLRWLRRHRPRAEREPVLVHGDLRLGNLIVDEAGLVAVLDWELARAGDPAEDFGWLCARSWRFGRDDRPALGLGSRDELLNAYVAAGGRPINRDELRWWEALANARWAAMCVLQAAVFLDDPGASLELGAIGRRACEAEWDLLAMLR